MIDYFKDEAGEWRYRVKGANGEPLATSEGYRDQTDAKRGFEALNRAVAASVFAPEWPHGIQRFTMPAMLEEDEHGNPVNEIDHYRGKVPPRIESGPVQFGDDWPGLWLRGDSCFAYALALRAERLQSADAFSRAGVDGLITALESTNINK
ncbi:MAG: YegP family protein [Solirubrobacterales bacterium]|jgi:uncharacterized protein YegP (UPF0339 family)